MKIYLTHRKDLGIRCVSTHHLHNGNPGIRMTKPVILVKERRQIKTGFNDLLQIKTGFNELLQIKNGFKEF